MDLWVFPFGAIVNKVANDIFYEVFVCFPFSWVKCPGVECRLLGGM